MATDVYPTEEELKQIREWPWADAHGLLDFIHGIWWSPDWGWDEFDGKEGDEPMRVVMASTGGWSGNEDIMAALHTNTLAYYQMFVSYRRGGHYHLMLPKRSA